MSPKSDAVRRKPHSPGGNPGAFAFRGAGWRKEIVVALLREPSDLDRPGVRARLRRADLVVFPELMEGGYAALKRGAAPRTMDAPVVHRMREVTRRTGTVCFAGTLFMRDGTRRPTNTALVFAGGRLRARYDKIHLFPPAGEARFFQRGRRPCTISLPGPGLIAGVMICFDLRFPELARTLAAQGARVLVVPARWPAARDDAWRTLLKARAVENQCFVVGCNSAGREGGRSYVFDPLGTELYAARRRPVPALVRLDLSKLKEARVPFDSLSEAVLPIGRRRNGRGR